MGVNYRMQVRRFFFVGLFFVQILSAVVKAQKTPPWYADPDAIHWADSVLKTLDLEDRIAQSFMVVSYAKGTKQEGQTVLRLIEKQHIGGVMYLQGSRDRMKELTQTYQAKTQVPLLMAIDAEWGTDMRLSDGRAYPKAMGIAATANPSLAYRMGELLAEELQEIGLHINFAPVVDVQRNPRNPVIGIRAFSDDPETVTQMGAAYMLGMQANGLIACAKHFPGHGNTSTDSHHALPIINESYQQLATCDIIPFQSLITQGLDMVMVAHIALPGLGLPPNEPASLRKEIVTSLLRDSLHFQGLICTDALNMKGATGSLKAEEVALQAYLAGSDILLCPENVAASIKHIARAVQKKRLSATEVATRTRRILLAKYYALHAQKKRLATYQANSTSEKQATERQRDLLSTQMAQEAVTLLRNSNAIVPITHLEQHKIGYVNFLTSKHDSLLAGMQRFAEVRAIHLNPKLSLDAQVAAATKNKTLIVIALSATGYAPSKHFGLKNSAVNFAKACAKRIPTILVFMGTPYALPQLFPLDDFAAVLQAYDTSTFTQDALSQVLFGALPAQGILPVHLPPDLKRGDGLTTQSGIRLSYQMPEAHGANPFFIARTDSLAQLGIDSAAYPGIQILAYHRGDVFYRKNYGHTTYSAFSPPVTDTTLYDLASVTKITATTPLVMRLVEKKKLHLDSTIACYLPEYKDTPIAKITLAQLLLHRAGLKAWKPFYIKTLEALKPGESIIERTQSAAFSIYMGKNRYMNQLCAPSPYFYADTPSDAYSIPVAYHLWGRRGMRDSILHEIATTPLEKKKGYRYSDWGFILLQQIVERVEATSIETLLQRHYWKPLGMWRTSFTPWKYALREACAPSEFDLFFRKTEVKGYVHDMAAAMLGGVAGHAGLFSTADDLAKYAALLIRGGEYGKLRYLLPFTIADFSQTPQGYKDNYRGYGFDKPNPKKRGTYYVPAALSLKSYGHIGFTGTILWIDPEQDFFAIVLSNRTYPDSNNTRINSMRLRAAIIEALYKSITQ